MSKKFPTKILRRSSSASTASIVYNTYQSRLASNELTQEPTLHPMDLREIEVSFSSETDFIPATEEPPKVAKLIRHFEELKFTNNAQARTTRRMKKTTTPVLSFQIHDIPEVPPTPDIIDSPDVFDVSFVETLSYDSFTASTEESNDLPGTRNLDKHNNEVYQTEITYINKLYVLCSILPAQVKAKCRKDKGLIKRFDHLYKPLRRSFKRLYKFHTGIVIPHLEEYHSGEGEDNHLWSIFKEHFQTIEDLYKQYYIALDSSQQELEQLCRHYPLIDKAMLACQKYLDNLYPITEFNCGNLRFLRYRLLMQTYMKHLNENSTGHSETLFIHDELAQIAMRCEEELTISPLQLLRLNARMTNKSDVVENQQLIWHGPLKKQSPRKHMDITQLYIIVFVDRILVCEESGQKLDVKRRLSVRNLTVDVINSRRSASTTSYYIRGQQLGSLTYYPFRVNAVEKSYEFLVDKESDKERWVRKIKQASELFEAQRSDIEIRRSCYHPGNQQFGLRAPVWVKDNEVTRCQSCHTRFEKKLIPIWRHHCRSCGQCVCTSCSTKDLILDYCKTEGEQRVCDACYRYLTWTERHSIRSSRITRQPEKSILFGDFRCISSKSMVWIDLQEDYQLHIYGGKLDRVEDFSINLVDLKDLSLINDTHTLILTGKEKTYKFSMEPDHQLIFQKNDYIGESVNRTTNKSEFYTNLWYDTMQLARVKTVPVWYTRKRDSADSGISAN